MTHEHAIASTVLLGAFALATTFLLLFVQQHDITGYATLGETNVTVNIINSTPVACGFNLSPGFNLVSGSCFMSRPVEEVMNSSNNITVWAVYEYTPAEPDKWKVYNPNLPEYVINDLEFMNRRSGYAIIMNDSATILLNGSSVPSTDIVLYKGWNLVGYPSNVTRSIPVVMAPVLASITNVTAYDKPNEQYISYPGGGLTNLTSGQGYWVNVTAGSLWTVPG